MVQICEKKDSYIFMIINHRFSFIVLDVSFTILQTIKIRHFLRSTVRMPTRIGSLLVKSELYIIREK